MTTERLPQLDALATAASGKPCRVFVSDDLDGLGEATYAPYYRCYCVWLHSSLMPGNWRQDQLPSVFWHEIGHLAAGHVNPASKHWDPCGRPHKAKADSRTHTVIAQGLLWQREEQANAMAGAIRNTWPYVAVNIYKISIGQETY